MSPPPPPCYNYSNHSSIIYVLQHTAITHGRVELSCGAAAAVQGGGGEGLAGEGCAEVARQTDPDGLPVVTHPLIDCVPIIL